jgi:hypothetical protein
LYYITGTAIKFGILNLPQFFDAASTISGATNSRRLLMKGRGILLMIYFSIVRDLSDVPK